MFDTLSRLERRRQRNPGIPLFARIAEEYLNRSDLDQALELCREGCEQFPAYSTGFFIKSRCLEAAGELEEARAALDMALRLDPDNPGGFVRLSDLYLQLGVQTLARKCLEHALSLDPFDLDLAARASELAQSVEGADADGAADELLVEPPGPVRDASEAGIESSGKAAIAAKDDDEEESGEDEIAVEGAGTGGGTSAEEVDAGAFDNLEETFASAFDDAIIGATEEDEGGSPGGLDPQGSEPFAAVEPLPEWSEIEEIEEIDESPDSPPTELLGLRDGKSSHYDEVAALGAELFGEDELSDMAPPPRGPAQTQDVRAAAPEPTEEASADEDISVESLAGDDSADQQLDASLMSEDVFGTDRTDDDELIGAPTEGSTDEPDDLIEEETPAASSGSEIADTAEDLDEEDILVDEPSGFETGDEADLVVEDEIGVERSDDFADDLDSVPVEAGEAGELAESRPVPTEEVLQQAPIPASAIVPVAAADRQPLEPERRVSRVSTRDDTELIDLFQEIGGLRPAQLAGQEPLAAKSAVEAEPVPTVTLAELYARQGFAERAMVTYRQILANEPDNEEVKSKLSTLERNW